MRCDVGHMLPAPTIHLVHSERKAQRLVERFGFEFKNNTIGDAVTWFLKRRGEMVAIVLLYPSDNTDAETSALLAHEATHITCDMLDAIGESEPASEERAYITQSVTLALLDAHDRWRAKREKRSTRRTGD